MTVVAVTNDRTALSEAFDRFARGITATAATDRTYFTFAEPEFDKLVLEVSAIGRYERDAEGWPAASRPHIRRIRANRDLQAFLDRENARDAILKGQFVPDTLAERFHAELIREHCLINDLIVLDGLELPSAEIKFRRGRFVRLSQDSFETVTGEKPGSYDQRLGLFALALAWQSPNPPWESGVHDDVETTQERCDRFSYPWVTLINLWGRGKVRVAGIIESSDSKLVRRPRRYIEIGEPIWEDHYKYNPAKDVDEWDSSSPRRTVSITDESKFIAFLEQAQLGLEKASGDHRANIAMRYFRRVADVCWHQHQGRDAINPDHDEDLIVDAVTALETILLANEKKGKGDIMAMRAAVLLADTPKEQRPIRRAMARLYKQRSAILHGDPRPSPKEMRDSAVDAEEYLRRCLGAFLLCGGDRRSILDAPKSSTVAAALRDKVKRVLPSA
jgi:hypothetical protein